MFLFIPVFLCYIFFLIVVDGEGHFWAFETQALCI